MTLTELPRMFTSEAAGWPDIARRHPSVAAMLCCFVAPMSLIPPVMYAYSSIANPGAVMPPVEPPLSGAELIEVGVIFFLIELAMVALMAAYVTRLGEDVDARPSYAESFTLAAIAPTPLWLSSLGMLVPNLWFNVSLVVLAWTGSVALIRHGVRPLFGLNSDARARSMAFAVSFAGVAAWLCLMAVLNMLLGIVLGWR